MDQWAFFDELKAGTVRNVYLFYGPEAYIRKSALAALEKKTLMPGLEELNRTVLSDVGAQQIIESCETMPMMSDYRLIIVKDCPLLMAGKARDEMQDSALLSDYLSRIPSTTCLVFEMSGSIDKRKKLAATLAKLPGAVSFDALDDAHLYKWMNQTLRPYGKRMERAACELLAFTSGRDLTLLSGEIAKLAAYVEDRESIGAADIEAIATRTAESTVFVMADAISEGRAQEAFSLLNVLLAAGEARIGILAMITRHYRQLMHLCAMREERVSQAQMARQLGVPPFAVGKLLKQTGKRTYQQMKECVELCVRADYDIKRGAIQEEAALERLMLVLLERQRA